MIGLYHALNKDKSVKWGGVGCRVTVGAKRLSVRLNNEIATSSTTDDYIECSGS